MLRQRPGWLSIRSKYPLPRYRIFYPNILSRANISNIAATNDLFFSVEPYQPVQNTILQAPKKVGCPVKNSDTQNEQPKDFYRTFCSLTKADRPTYRLKYLSRSRWTRTRTYTHILNCKPKKNAHEMHIKIAEQSKELENAEHQKRTDVSKEPPTV